MKKILELAPGIAFCAFIAFISKTLSSYLAINSLTIAIVLGIIYANTVGLQKQLQVGTKFTLKKLLKLGIIFLGVELDFIAIYAHGPKILALAILVVVVGVFLAPYIAKLFGFNSRLAMLLGIGSSVCGTSAIVASAPVILADDNDTALSVAIISLLGAIGVIIYPIIGTIVKFSDVQFGFWSGSSLQGVAHALAAAATKSELALEMATYVKMTRVVLLAPLTLFLVRWCTNNPISEKISKSKAKVKMPLYIILFILVGILSTLGLFNFQLGSQSMQVWMKLARKELILWAMVAMGLGVNLNKLKKVGLRAFFAGSSIFLVISLIAGVFVKFLF